MLNVKCVWEHNVFLLAWENVLWLTFTANTKDDFPETEIHWLYTSRFVVVWTSSTATIKLQINQTMQTLDILAHWNCSCWGKGKKVKRINSQWTGFLKRSQWLLAGGGTLTPHDKQSHHFAQRNPTLLLTSVPKPTQSLSSATKLSVCNVLFPFQDNCVLQWLFFLLPNWSRNLKIGCSRVSPEFRWFRSRLCSDPWNKTFEEATLNGKVRRHNLRAWNKARITNVMDPTWFAFCLCTF